MGRPKANLHNWMTPPHNRYAFVHMDHIMPVATVKKAQTASDLPEQLRDFTSFELRHDDQKLDLNAYLAHSSTDGLMVLQDGKVLYEYYSSDNARQSKHIIMSLSKSITGLLVGILQGQGKLSVNDAVIKHVPEVESTIWKHVTIQQCLDMRTGAKYVDGQHEYRAASGWYPMHGGEKHANLKQFLSNFEPDEVIDDRFEYVSVNTDLLGWVIERVTGKTFAQNVEELLWQPMGAESDAQAVLDPAGFARAAGGLCVTLPDLARVAQLILNHGKNTVGDVVVPADWIVDILHRGSKDAWQSGAFARAFDSSYSSMAYRSCCYADEDTEVIMGWGVYGQHFSVDMKNKIVLVTTASQEAALGFDKIVMTMGAFKEFQRIVLSYPSPERKLCDPELLHIV